VRVGIGALVGVLGGPATYARELVTALAAEPGDDTYVVFTDQPDAFAGLGVTTVHVPLRSIFHQVTWDHARLPALIAREHVDLYHGTKNVLPWRLAVPGVVTVHDLAVYACPETFAWPQRLHFQWTVPGSVRRAARVVTVSHHARGDIVARFGLPPARVPVVSPGVAPAFFAPPRAGAVPALRTAYGLGEKLIACVGTIQPRKHVERVIEAFVRAGAAAQGWELVVAGRTRPGFAPPWLTSLPPGVHWVGPLRDEALRALYAAAEVAMSASEYEGFGLTVAEAMAAGCAVVAVAATSIPEVVGRAGVLVPRSDPGLLAAALGRLLAEPDARAALATAGRTQAAGFTWRETARRMRAVYAEALAG
jgi:glycosyltransferase involved in cell wall biosynthesis